ncbi:uncharacterized protein J3D65DRAFT_612875 [Phyllosticta citribraziliensis]|uniref:Zn(2)-C6 fungal-type domain-containing protein n=1 Tax=Phyllosticta citribraziliensis TaxID=989973 RepID=A0ABR1M3K1_9PEZI
MTTTETRAERRRRVRKPRGRGLRTRTGCTTCRRRHLKCDEVTPLCGPCAKSNHECVYANASRDEVRASQVAQESGAPPRPSDFSEQSFSLADSLELNSAISPEGVFHAQYDDADAATSTLPVTTTAADDSTASPGDSSYTGVSGATARWFGLLLDDAALGLEIDAGNAFQLAAGAGDALFRPTNPLDPDSAPHFSPVQSSHVNEHALWQCPERLQLLPNQCLVFENFVRRVASFMDLFDAERHFSVLVPRLAMYNAGLMNALLALSARHLSLNPSVALNAPHDRNGALKYYYETLHYVQKAMQFDSYKTSLELLATALIVSTYEMFDGSRKDWERHLKGVFWIQRSQEINGESGGLRAAIWMAWLTQDTWAAFRENRRAFTIFRPTRALKDLNEYELACRSVFLFTKAVNYCSKEEVELEPSSIAARAAKADGLLALLQEWQSFLTLKFAPLPINDSVDSDIFQPIWIHPPAFAVAIQLHHAARILIHLNRPSVGGLGGYMRTQKEVAASADTIAGIAMPLNDDGASLISSQCLFIAGMCTTDARKRDAILVLIDACRQRTGWPIKPLGEELQELWSRC